MFVFKVFPTQLLFSRFADEIRNVYGNFVMYLLFVLMLSELFGSIITPKFDKCYSAASSLTCLSKGNTNVMVLDCKPLITETLFDKCSRV